jgi:hypothetical protein
VAYAILLFGLCDELSSDMKTRYARIPNNYYKIILQKYHDSRSTY